MMKWPTTNDNEAGIYIHIPFCRKACHYCNFHFSTSLKLKSDFLEALKKEIALRSNYLEGKQVTTIYFGGGTPSVLTATEINDIVQTLHQHYPIGTLREVTLEANPDDLTPEYIDSLKDTAVNRLSIGIQSFQQAELEYMNRSHTAAQATNAIDYALNTHRFLLTIDLIYGGPLLTDEQWAEHLKKVAIWGIPHFSAYALTVEEKTALDYAIRSKNSPPVDPEKAARHFTMLMEFARTNGYDHYEISNFAKPGMHAVHNTHYWMGCHYLGLGPSAHSFNGSSRSWNAPNNALYIKALTQNLPAPGDVEVLTERDTFNEYVMTSLRTQWGCNLQKIENNWGAESQKYLLENSQHYVSEGKMILHENHLYLTSAGRLFADAIASDLFWV